MTSAAELRIIAGVVLKRHAAGTDVVRLRQRLALAVDSDAFVPPLLPEVLIDVDGRAVTAWPKVPVPSVNHERLPWAAAGVRLAALHRRPVPPDAPPHGFAARLARAVERAPDDLADLGRRLAGHEERSAPVTVLHGDFHLGQLGHWSDGWRLLDIDDVGIGDPAWDLARPAGFWAAGLLPDVDWHAFLDGYRDAGGPAVPAKGDPWPALDLVARRAVFVAAVRESRAGDLHSADTARALVAACRRMAQ